MKKHIITFLAATLCLMAPVAAWAQKKATPKKKAATEVTYPQRDSAFKPDYKMKPIGTFDPDNVANIEYMLVPAPDFTGHVLKRDPSRKQVKLTQEWCGANEIVDDEWWFEKNDLPKREERVETPMNQFGPRFRYRTGGYLITTYGDNWGYTMNVVITDEEQETLYAAYYFANFKYSPKTTLMGNYQSVNDFVIEGNILYVAHGSNGYSDGAGYQTGYLTAFDMEKQEIIWTTLPMTCNSHIAIVGNSIICGYGFTSEPDYLYILDKYSGQRIKRIPMKKMVNEVVPRGDLLYVRTYSYDYLFKIE